MLKKQKNHLPSDNYSFGASQVEYKTNGNTMEFVISFKYLGSCFSNFGVLQEDEKIREGEGLKTFGELKILFDGRSEGLGVERVLY